MMETLNEIVANFFLYVFGATIILVLAAFAFFILLTLIPPTLIGLLLYFLFTGQGLWALLPALGLMIYYWWGDNYFGHFPKDIPKRRWD